MGTNVTSNRRKPRKPATFLQECFELTWKNTGSTCGNLVCHLCSQLQFTLFWKAGRWQRKGSFSELRTSRLKELVEQRYAKARFNIEQSKPRISKTLIQPHRLSFELIASEEWICQTWNISCGLLVKENNLLGKVSWNAAGHTHHILHHTTTTFARSEGRWVQVGELDAEQQRLKAEAGCIWSV